MQDLIECDGENHDPSAYETEPSDLGVGISIMNLTKVYDTVSITSDDHVCVHFCVASCICTYVLNKI